MPLLKKASRIVVLTVQDGTVPWPTGEELARYLDRNGVPSEPITVQPESRSTGEPSWRSDQDSYLNESATRVRNAVTFPFSTLMSIFVTSATRKSRSEPAAVSTAFRPASSHDFSLTPTTSTIR
jgi:hypothetical protein